VIAETAQLRGLALTIIRISTSNQTIPPDTKNKFAESLARAFCTIEVGHDSAPALQGFCVIFDSHSPADVWMGGNYDSPTQNIHDPVDILAFVLSGPWNDEMNREIYAAFKDVVLRIVPAGQGNQCALWMTILEVPEGRWSVDGKTISAKNIAPIFAEDRRARITAFLNSVE
jgi:hypothetical protein